MVTRGTKSFDPATQTRRVDWLVVSAHECPDQIAERRLIAAHFRIPHEPWAPYLAFVQPVIVRRSRRRVLFRQECGQNALDEGPIRSPISQAY